MRILILGDLGTVGVPLRRELEARGHLAFGGDLRHTGNANSMRVDISKREQVQRVIEWCEPEMIYCLAAEFGRHNGEIYYPQCWETNVIGGRHVMEECAARNIRLVFMSSSEAYGEAPQVLMREGDTDEHPLRHHNDYAMSKWVNEQQIMNLERERSDFEAVRVRFFNAYGPGEYFTPFRSVVCLFVHAAITGGDYTVFRGYHRVFMYIDDAARTLANIADNFIPGRVYNIGGEEYCSVEHLHNLIAKKMGGDFSARVEFLGQDGHNTVNKRPDISLAKDEIGHALTVDLNTGIGKTIEWARNVYQPSCLTTSDSKRSA
jgi:dTDP-glucose 4,6-dehydratase